LLSWALLLLWSGSKCNRKVRALKSFSVEAAPRVLTLHLKRFAIGGGGFGGGGRKIDRWVEFGTQLGLLPLPLLAQAVTAKALAHCQGRVSAPSPAPLFLPLVYSKPRPDTFQWLCLKMRADSEQGCSCL